MSQPDVIVQDHGTIVLFYPRSERAQEWWSENVEDGPSLGRNHAVEHRLAQRIVDGLVADGLEIN